MLVSNVYRRPCARTVTLAGQRCVPLTTALLAASTYTAVGWQQLRKMKVVGETALLWEINWKFIRCPWLTCIVSAGSMTPHTSCMLFQWPHMHCTVGWVDFGLFFTFSTNVPLRFVTYKKFFLPSSRFFIGHYFLGHALYKGPTFFSQYELYGYQKTPNFYIDFKNINLS
jgi:hypothetical protein